MTQPPSITLLNVINVGYKRPTCSLWAIWGEYDFDDPFGECDDYERLENSKKIVGPVDAQIVMDARKALAEMFEAIGWKVVLEDTADD